MDVYGHLVPFLLASPDVCATRRRVILAPLLAAVPLAMAATVAQAMKINPSETVITLPDAIRGSPGADSRRAAAKWRRSTVASTSPGPISC